MMIATSTTITATSGLGSRSFLRRGPAVNQTRTQDAGSCWGGALRDGYALRGLDGRGAGGGVGAIGEGVVRLGLRRIEGTGLLKRGLAIARGCLLNGCTARGAELGIICKKLAARGAIPRHCHSFRHISMQYDDYTHRSKFPIISCGEIGTVWRSQSFNQSLFHRNFGKAPIRPIGDAPSTGVSWLGWYICIYAPCRKGLRPWLLSPLNIALSRSRASMAPASPRRRACLPARSSSLATRL